MAIGGIAGAWTPNAPSDSSNVGLGAGDIRSLKTQVQQPLDSEHVFTAAGDTVMGAHRPGSAVAFFGTASRVSSADTDGRIMLTSDTSRLYSVANSQTSMLIGGRYVAHANPVYNNNGSNLTSQVTQFWGTESGRVQLTTGTAAVTLKHTYLTGGHVNVALDNTTAPPSTMTLIFAAQVNGATLTINSYTLTTGVAFASSAIVSYQVFGRVSL
jgi:hypothetical protein